MIRASEPQKSPTTVRSPHIVPLGRSSMMTLSALLVSIFSIILAVCTTPAFAQDFDPRCSDRSATGKFVCPIDRPIVNRPEFVYSNVVFAPGDTVYVKADGCVQTGGGIGSGNTWKRYVNPGGANSDHLYHGLVRIPTAKLAGTDVGNSLPRIKNVVGRSLFVTGKTADGVDVPTSKLVLHLGYEDDDLSDNGYDSHDDGTEDQCKGDSRNDGGPAHVTITICRRVPCGPTTSRFDFDVLSSQMDPNGFLMNPHWSWQDRPENHGDKPDTSLCHEFSKHDVGRPWYRPNFPDCTDQAGLDDVDTPDGINEQVCRDNRLWDDFHTGDFTSEEDLLSGGIYSYLSGRIDSFIGHINWFPITVEGRVGPKISHEVADDDYDFSLYCDDKIQVDNTFVVDEFLKKSCAQQDWLYTNRRPYLHVEFDYDETIKHFNIDPWVDLRDNVDSAGWRFTGHTIMTGLFGLDGEHKLKTEMHPLYAMALRRDMESSPSDEVWLMFLRNRGDEGGCSSLFWDGGFNDYTFRLPWRDGMASVEVNWDKTQFEGTPGTSTEPIVRLLPPIAAEHRLASNAGAGDLTSSGGIFVPNGVYVTFHLGSPPAIPRGRITLEPPASILYIDGVLHLKWTAATSGRGHTAAGGLLRPGGSGIATAVATETAKAGESNEPENRLEVAVKHLPPRERISVQKSRAIASPPMPAVHRMFRGGAVEVLTAPPSTGVLARSTGPHDPIAGPAGRAQRKLARDEAQMRALCAATNNAPKGLPAEVCKSNVRDHRTKSLRDHRK
jgi:hypothetical protein